MPLNEKEKQKVLVTVAIVVISLFVLFSTVYAPMAKKIEEGRIVVEDIRTRVEAQQSVLDQRVPGALSAYEDGIKVLKNDYDKRLVALSKKEDVLTRGKDVSRVVDTIISLAENNADLKITGLIQHIKIPNENLYDRRPINLEISGRYLNILKFVGLVNDMLKLAIIEDMTLTVDETNPPNLKAILTINIFLKDDE